MINNDGYMVEWFIYGMYEFYNEIYMWDYKVLLVVFGGKNVEIYDVELLKDL